MKLLFMFSVFFNKTKSFCCGFYVELFPQITEVIKIETHAFLKLLMQLMSNYSSKYLILPSSRIKKYLKMHNIQRQKWLDHRLDHKLTLDDWCCTRGGWKLASVRADDLTGQEGVNKAPTFPNWELHFPTK